MKAHHRLVLDIRGIPELMAEFRGILSRMLREEAEGENDPRVARRLREIAADFEVGIDSRR